MRVFVNTAPKLLKIVRQSFTDKNRLKRIPIGARLYGSLGQVLRLEFFDQEERLVSVLGTQELSPAKNAPLCKEQAELEIASLSSSPFILEKFEFLVEPSLFIHQRELKELRRKAAQALQDLRISRNPQIQNQDATITEWQIEDARALALTRQDNEAKLHVVVREKEQLEALRGLPLGTVYLDFEFGKEYAPSLEDLKGMGLSGGIASTRILKPGEHGHLKQLQRLKPDSVLVRNLGALESLKDSGLKLVGDFSLNAANSLSTRWLLAQGLTRLCPSYDLNQSQLEALLAAVPAQFFEVTVHQYMPAFHMEHCVFAAFLSKGSSYRDCGRPCEKHRIELKDPSGNLHPVKADAECRNTMFHGTPQAAARLVPSLLDLGVQHFRVEALYETPSELRKKLMSYLDLIHGASTPNTILKDLNLLERYGVSEGQLLNSKNWKDRKKDSLKEIW